MSFIVTKRVRLTNIFLTLILRHFSQQYRILAGEQVPGILIELEERLCMVEDKT